MQSPATYRVVCDLDIDQFEQRRDGRAAARAAISEIRRLRRCDERIRSVRHQRVGRGCVRVSIELNARSPHEAADVGHAIVRTGVHAAGGATTGWGQIKPEWIGDEATLRSEVCTTWAAHTAAALRRLEASRPALPLFSTVSASPMVIDLR